MKENLFIPFLFVEKAAVGTGFVKQSNPPIHFAMVDTGAQVGCIHSCMLDLYPTLNRYFIPQKEVLKGVGSIICEVEGSLHRLPICLGT